MNPLALIMAYPTIYMKKIQSPFHYVNFMDTLNPCPMCKWWEWGVHATSWKFGLHTCACSLKHLRMRNSRLIFDKYYLQIF